MKIKKEHLILIIFSAVMLLIVFAIAYLALTTPTKPNNKPIGTISPSPVYTGHIAISPTPVNPGVPPVSYSSDATDRLIEKVQNHPQLSDSDIAAKQKILSFLPQGKTSGYVYQSSTVQIEYLKSPDAFLAEILTIDIAQSKKDAVNWFKVQGMSQKGICDLPVSFYLNSRVANQLRNLNIKFSPLAEGC